eukprot:1637322-Prymnesium_polylepis.1
MIAQHSPTTQGSAHLPEARARCASDAAPPALARPRRQRRKACGTCKSRSPHGFGRGAHRAVRPPGQR